jgi:tripartite-type tricarboxylate transporter receptor subunit TctC
MNATSILWRAVLALSVLTTNAVAAEPAFPTKTVSIVVPFAPGGPTDVVVRPLAQRLAEKWGQPVILDQRSGANGIIAAQYTIKAPADGYTLMFGISGLIQNLSLQKKQPYDFFKDLTPVALIGRQANGVAVSSNSPYKTIGDLVAALKTDGGKMSYGSFGIGSSSHIYGQLLNSKLGGSMPHVAYRGEGPLMPDLMTGRVSLAFVSAATAVIRSKDGTLRVLAVTGPDRLPMLPEVPTLAEVGLSGFDLLGWWGIFMPTGVPAAVAEKISRDVHAVLREPEMRARLGDYALVPDEANSAQLTNAFKAEFKSWDALIKRFNISAD